MRISNEHRIRVRCRIAVQVIDTHGLADQFRDAVYRNGTQPNVTVVVLDMTLAAA